MKIMKRILLNIEKETEDSFPFPCQETAEAVCRCVLAMEECPYDTEISLLITGPEEIREMNREFRGIDSATDVLSFPMVDYEEGPSDFACVEGMEAEYFDPETDALMLGDIVLNTERIREQAAEFGHSLLREYAFLIAHSMLHLCGYDHMTPEEAGLMEEKQNLVMQELGLLRDLDQEAQMENLHAYQEKVRQA